MKGFITSRVNARVQALAALGQGKHRREQGLTLAEGLHLVTEAFASGAPITALVVSERGIELPEAGAIVKRAEARGVEIVRLNESCYEKISQLKSPEGIAVTLRTEGASLESVLAGSARVLVAAGVQDPGNAGALVRTAEAAGASGCVFLGGVDLSHPRFIRGAQSSSFRLPCAACEEREFLAALAKTSVRLLVAVPRGAVDYQAADYTPPVAIVVGGEGQGVPETLAAVAQARISIPMSERVESLNVAVAAGILLYQARRQWM